MSEFEKTVIKLLTEINEKLDSIDSHTSENSYMHNINNTTENIEKILLQKNEG